MKVLRTACIVLVPAAGAAGGGYFWWQQQQSDLPDGWSRANGRIEAEWVDVAPRFSGRVADVLADEGQLVAAGDVIARIDSTELEAQVRAAEAATGDDRCNWSGFLFLRIVPFQSDVGRREMKIDALELPAGSMGPKMTAARDFASMGRFAGIGRLGEAVAIPEGRAGTCVLAAR